MTLTAAGVLFMPAANAQQQSPSSSPSIAPGPKTAPANISDASPDVARADDATRAVYEAELTRLAEVLAAGFRGAHATERAWSFLAVLSGAAAMARAVKDDRLRREILDAARTAAKAL